VTERDYERDWLEFWADICTREGELDLEAVKKELSDFRLLIENMVKVYDHVTGGKTSNVLVDPDVIISLHDAYVQQQIDEALDDELEDRLNDAVIELRRSQP